jgi:hypothetical protein
MKGILPWETLPNSYFVDKITWEFTCLNKSTDNPEKLAEFWLPDQHDLHIRTIINLGSCDERLQRVLSSAINPKWILSWHSAGTNLCGSSELASHHPEYVDIVCTIPMGNCLKNLTVEPAAIRTNSVPDKDGLFSPPPGAVLTQIQPLTITFGEAPVFPLYEKYGDGRHLIKWRIPVNFVEYLREDMSRLISVEVDLNHELLKTHAGEIEIAGQQKKALLYQTVISDYLRIICSDDDVINVIYETSFPPGTAGFSINWLLVELSNRCNFSEVRDLCLFFRKNPAELSKTVDQVFSSLLLK